VPLSNHTIGANTARTRNSAWQAESAPLQLPLLIVKNRNATGCLISAGSHPKGGGSEQRRAAKQRFYMATTDQSSNTFDRSLLRSLRFRLSYTFLPETFAALTG